MKKYKLRPGQFRELVPPQGYCLASDRITVDGLYVGYCYRETPDNPDDSGWRFFSGDESDEYANNPENLAFYEVNTIANYDPGIIPLLSTAAPCAFAREPDGPLRPVTPPPIDSE